MLQKGSRCRETGKHWEQALNLFLINYIWTSFRRKQNGIQMSWRSKVVFVSKILCKYILTNISHYSGLSSLNSMTLNYHHITLNQTIILSHSPFRLHQLYSLSKHYHPALSPGSLVLQRILIFVLYHLSPSFIFSLLFDTTIYLPICHPCILYSLFDPTHFPGITCMLRLIIL